MPLSADSATTRRRQYLALALRRARPGSGSAREFLLTRTWEGLPPVSIDLARLSTSYVIVGAVATALYMPQRFTYDLDLLVVSDDAPTLHRELLALGCSRTGTLSIGRTSWVAADGGRLDVIESSEPWVRDAISNASRAPDGSAVIPLPYLVLMKLAASRAQDVADLTRMLGQADDAALDEVRSVVEGYRPEDREDVESLIALGRLELQDG